MAAQGMQWVHCIFLLLQIAPAFTTMSLSDVSAVATLELPSGWALMETPDNPWHINLLLKQIAHAEPTLFVLSLLSSHSLFLFLFVAFNFIQHSLSFHIKQ